MTAARCCLAPIRPGTDAYHAPHRVEPTLALGAEATVRFLALGMQSRIPSSRIDLHTCTGQGRRARRTGSASRARSWAAYRIQTRPSARPRARPTSRLAGSRWKSKRKARPAHSQEAHRQLHGISSSWMRLFALRSSQRSAFWSGPQAGSHRRFCARLFAVLELELSSLQYFMTGLSVEIA